MAVKKKVVCVQGLSLDAVHRRKAMKLDAQEENEGLQC